MFIIIIIIMSPALAHVPPAHVKASVELVIEEITDFLEREQFEESVVFFSVIFLFCLLNKIQFFLRKNNY